MFKSFWFYFYLSPVLFGIFSFYQLTKLPPRGSFKDALEYCKDIDNNEIIPDQGTRQDICIDNFIIGNFTEGFVWTFFITIGLIFLIPLSIYLLHKIIQ